MPGTDPGGEDAIVAQARAARDRIGSGEGAAVRDTDGRIHAAATVDLPSLELTALQAAVTVALAAGAGGLEAAAVVTDSDGLDDNSLAAVHDVSRAAPVLVADLRGHVLASIEGVGA